MRAFSIQFYKQYRFTLTAKAPGKGPFAVTSIWCDAFQRDRVWIGAGIAEGRQTLDGYLRAPEDKVLTVSLLDREGNVGREITFSFESHEWLPFDLDARGEDAATEHVVLSGVKWL